MSDEPASFAQLLGVALDELRWLWNNDGVNPGTTRALADRFTPAVTDTLLLMAVHDNDLMFGEPDIDCRTPFDALYNVVYQKLEDDLDAELAELVAQKASEGEQEETANGMTLEEYSRLPW